MHARLLPAHAPIARQLSSGVLARTCTGSTPQARTNSASRCERCPLPGCGCPPVSAVTPLSNTTTVRSSPRSTANGSALISVWNRHESPASATMRCPRCASARPIASPSAAPSDSLTSNLSAPWARTMQPVSPTSKKRLRPPQASMASASAANACSYSQPGHRPAVLGISRGGSGGARPSKPGRSRSSALSRSAPVNSPSSGTVRSSRPMSCVGKCARPTRARNCCSTNGPPSSNTSTRPQRRNHCLSASSGSG